MQYLLSIYEEYKGMIYKVMQEMINYFGKDAVRINHALKVFDYASLIAYNENLSDQIQGIVSYTALLHDIGIKEAERKYNSSDYVYQHREGPPVAEKILNKTGVDKEITDRCCFIIGNHHSYNMIDNVDFQIIAESDFIVNAFEKNLKKEDIKDIYGKLFKTDSGKNIITSMF